MTKDELAFLAVLDQDRLAKGVKGKQVMPYVGKPVGLEGATDKYMLGAGPMASKPPRAKRKLRRKAGP